MKNDSKRLRHHDKIKSFFVLAIRFFIETAGIVAVYLILRFSVFDDPRLLFAVIPAAILLSAALRIPLRFGTLLFFLNRESDRENTVKNLFAFFSPKLFFSAIKNGLFFLGFYLLCFFIFFLPCISMLVLMCYNILHASSFFLTAAFTLAFLLLLFSAAAAFFKLKKLTFLSEYLFILTPEKKAADSLTESAELLNGKTSLVTAIKLKNFFSRIFCALVLPAVFLTRRCTERKAHLAYELLKERK